MELEDTYVDTLTLKSNEDMILARDGKTWAQQIELLSTVWLRKTVG